MTDQRHTPPDASTPGTVATDAPDDVGGLSPEKALQLAKESYKASTDWVDANRRAQWDRNERLFQSKHPQGSKYLSSHYAHRSKVFRPKSRAAARRAEAHAAQAYFSTQDVVSIAPHNEESEDARVGAEIMTELLNYRLTAKGKAGIPWFLTVLGAVQDTRKNGVCCSKQWWEYEEEEYEETVTRHVVTEAGDIEEVTETTKGKQPRLDRPRVKLFPIENLRFDPAADWVDPVADSPYLILMHSMFVGDVKARMDTVDPKTGQPQWKKLDDATLTKAKTVDHDSVRNAREGSWETKNRETAIRDHDIIWCHENFVRHEGREYVYWTAGVHELLTDPAPLEEVYWHGERPIAIGYCLLEAHKPYPSGHIELSQEIQTELNEAVNLRLDAVKFNITPVQKVRRGRRVDMAALTSLYPGKPIQMDDPVSDVVIDRGPSVGAEAYQEEDRINLSYDDMVGTFSQASVDSNRNTGRTVGGLNLISGISGALGEYDLRVFTETWVEKVLSQLVKLEQAYETDETVLALAGTRAGVWGSLRIDPTAEQDLLAHLIQNELAVTVNVGIGATDPMQQLQRFMFGMSSLQGIAGALMQAFGPGVMESPGFKEIAGEIFGKLGYKDSSRFLDFKVEGQQSPEQMQTQQALQAAQAEAGALKQEKQSKVADTQTKMALGQQKSQMEQTKATTGFQIDRAKHQMDMEKMQAGFMADMAKARMPATQTVNVV